MTPPKKVYEKRKKGKGASSQQGELKKLTPKKRKKNDTQLASSPPEVHELEGFPDTQPNITPAPTLQPTAIDPAIDQVPPIPFPSLEATPESVPVPTQSEPTTAEIMRMIGDLNEDIWDGGNQNREEADNVEGEEVEKEADNVEGEEVGGEAGSDDEEGPFDNYRFSNRRAEKDFENNWSKRSVIVERGMTLSHFRTEEFELQQNFEKRGWTKWAQFSGVAVTTIVREFYANMTGVEYEGKDCILTKVRGVFFKIYPKDIRRFFDLKEERHPQFPFSPEEALDKDALAKILTGKPSAEWGHKKKLAKNRLSPKFNSLHFLACSQLNPVLNTSEISYERGLLLYAIDQGLRIELGQLIWDNIAALIKTRKGVSGLPFAGLITKYVCKKKVNAELGEQVAKPPGPITASSRERSASHKKAREGATLDQFMERIHDNWDEARVTLGEVKNDQEFIKKELLEQRKKIEAMDAKLDLLIAANAGISTLPPEDDHADS